MDSAVPRNEERPSGVVLVAGDGTALRLAARILDTAPVPVAYLSAGLVFLQCNAAAARLLGTRSQHVLGRALRDAVPGSRLLQTASETLESRAPATGILRDGERGETAVLCTPDVDAKGRLLGVLVTDASIATPEQAAASEALRDSEALFRTTFELSPAGVTQADASGRFMRVNRRFAEMLGHPIVRVQQMSWEDITHPEDRDANRAAYAALLAGERDEVTLEKRYLRSDGTPVWALTSLAAVRAEDRSLRFVVGVVQDVSEHKHAEELAAAYSRIDAAIHSTLDFGEMVQRVVVEAVGALGCDSGRVALREGERWVTRFGHMLPFNSEDRAYADDEVPEFVLAARRRRVVAVDDAQGDTRTNGEAMRAAGIRSVLVVPLVSRDQVVGVISFACHGQRKDFTPADISFAEHVASSANVALENARLYDTQHMLADTLQDAMVRMPERMDGIRFCWLYRSATEAARVGGDFLDLFALDDGRVAVLIGDVSGKGVEAAALTTLMKNVVRAYAHEESSPARVLARLNRTVERETADDVFATVFFGVLDPLTGWLAYCSGGHPPGLLRRADGTVRRLQSESPLVGALPELEFANGFEQLAEGDILLLSSDGVLEARDASRAMFGEARLIEALVASSAGEVCEDVFQAVSAFSDGSLGDDLALLAIALDPTETPHRTTE